MSLITLENLSNLSAIRTKVRRLARAPTEGQLPSVILDRYINEFVVFDLPAHLKLNALKKTLTFYTDKGRDSYGRNQSDALNPSDYYSVLPPAYVAGYEAQVYQTREEFFRIFPFNAISHKGATGMAGRNVYAFTVPGAPFLRRSITISSVTPPIPGVLPSGRPLILRDNGGGLLFPPDSNTGVISGLINYATGAVNAVFQSIPAVGADIIFQGTPVTLSRPYALLYYENNFVLRPVPDKTYKVEIDAYQIPSLLLSRSSNPEIYAWWQFIAIGAAKKIMEDRFDFESVARILPLYEEQKRLVLRKTIVQQTSRRTATIYSDSVYSPGLGANGGFSAF